MKPINISLVAGAGSFAILAVAIALSGCASSGAKNSTAAQSKPASATKAASTRGGAELWAANCAHCHNIRSPSFYSDAQWDVAMMHMRVRANLTAEEHRKILEFLKSAD